MGQDAGVDHQQFFDRARLAPEHDPTEADLRIGGQDDLGQLRLADALVQAGAQPLDLGVFLLGGQWRQMQIVVHPQRARARSGRHGVHADAHACQQGVEKLARLDRQRQPGVMPLGFGLPALLGQEQALAATEGQGVFDPDRAVAQRAAQGKQGGRLQGPEGALAVGIGNGLAPSRTQPGCHASGGKHLGAGGVLRPQLGQRVEHRMLAAGTPGQSAHGCQQRAHRRDRLDQALVDERCAAGGTPGPLGGHQIVQARTQLGIGYRALGGQFGQLPQKLLVLLCPIDRGRYAVGALPPQVGHPALEHEDQPIGGREQTVAQEATHLDHARRLLDSGADRRRPAGHAAGVAAHQNVVEIAQVAVHPQLREQRDALDHFTDLARGMLGRGAPQPTLAVLAVFASRLHRREPALQGHGRHRGADRVGRGSLQFGQRCGDQASECAVVRDDQPVLVQPMPGMQEQPFAVDAAGDFVAQNPHECAALVLGHPGKARALQACC